MVTDTMIRCLTMQSVRHLASARGGVPLDLSIDHHGGREGREGKEEEEEEDAYARYVLASPYAATCGAVIAQE